MNYLPESIQAKINEMCNAGNTSTDLPPAHSSSSASIQSQICGVPHRYNNVSFADTQTCLNEVTKKFALEGNGVLIIIGDNGTGKTRLVSACINERIARELCGGRYISCSYEVCPLIRSSRSFSANKSEMETLREFYTTPFLVLDEVGKGDDIQTSKAFVQNVLAARYDNNLPTVIATNLDKDGIVDFVGKEISSRLKETARMYALNNKDWRSK